MTRNHSLVMTGNAYDRLPVLEIESHMTKMQYGNFILTDAIRPSYDLMVVPRQGYQKSFYKNPCGDSVPVIIASVSAENIFETFLDLLAPVGDVVDVVLETSHRHGGGEHKDLCREQIDLSILKSFLCHYEEILLNDGCTGLAVLNPETETEVQFDEHKLFYAYSPRLSSFEQILKRHNVRRSDKMRFLTESEHIHTTRDAYLYRFKELKNTLGID